MDQGLDTNVTMHTVSDETLMAGILAFEQASLDHLYGRYRLLFGKIISQILPNEADSEETLQDVFVEIWKRAGRFDAAKGKPLGWMICMVRRRAIDHLRRVRRRAELSDKLYELSAEGHDVLPLALSSMTTPDDQTAAKDLHRQLRGVIGSLPPDQQQVVELTYFHELSQRQIAARTGVPLGTIKTRLELAIRKLSQRSTHMRQDLS